MIVTICSTTNERSREAITTSKLYVLGSECQALLLYSTVRLFFAMFDLLCGAKLVCRNDNFVSRGVKSEFCTYEVDGQYLVEIPFQKLDFHFPFSVNTKKKRFKF